MTKIDIISGFLGAGKTTFIKKLINEVYCDEKLVLIENEFGEVNIDSTFLKDTDINVSAINSGCICCSMVGDFETSLKEAITLYHPDRIIIEPSGVGKLSDVIKAVKKIEQLEIDNCITIVDAKKCRLYTKNFGEFFNNQIEAASTIILSKSHDISEYQLDECIKIIKKYNDRVNIITTPWSSLTKEIIIKALKNNHDLQIELHPCHHHHDCNCKHHHHADEVFTSWSMQTPKKYSREQLDNILTKLNTTLDYGTILRAKGYVDSFNDDWWYFDLVLYEYEIRKGQPDFTGCICIIGNNLNDDKLDQLFNEVL